MAATSRSSIGRRPHSPQRFARSSSTAVPASSRGTSSRCRLRVAPARARLQPGRRNRHPCRRRRRAAGHRAARANRRRAAAGRPAVDRAPRQRARCVRAARTGARRSHRARRRRDDHWRDARRGVARADGGGRRARRVLGRRANASSGASLSPIVMTAIESPSRLAVVLVHPEIPPNTGNVIRLTANTATALHLVEPLGFRMDDRGKRAGLDYHRVCEVLRVTAISPRAPRRSTKAGGAGSRSRRRRPGRWRGGSLRRPGDVLRSSDAESSGLWNGVLCALRADARLCIPIARRRAQASICIERRSPRHAVYEGLATAGVHRRRPGAARRLAPGFVKARSDRGSRLSKRSTALFTARPS